MVRNLGSAYCDKLELGPEDEEWQCPHCNRAPIKEHQDACSLVLKWPDDVEKVRGGGGGENADSSGLESMSRLCFRLVLSVVPKVLCYQSK